jgi:hypothetical protein
MDPFGDPAVFEELLGALGAAERARLKAVKAGRAVCPDHPLEGPAPPAGGCRCRRWPIERRVMDDREARQQEADDAATGLTCEQREALCGGIAAMYAAGAAARLRGGGA